MLRYLMAIALVAGLVLSSAPVAADPGGSPPTEGCDFSFDIKWKDFWFDREYPYPDILLKCETSLPTGP